MKINRRLFLHRTGWMGMGAMAGSMQAWSHLPDLERTRVVVIRDESVFDSRRGLRSDVLQSMLEKAMQALAGVRTKWAGWEKFFDPSDRVGIKSTRRGTLHHTMFMTALMNSLASLGISDERMRVWDNNRGGIGRGEVDHRAWSWVPEYDTQSVSRVVGWADGLLNAPCLSVHPWSCVSGSVMNWLGAVTQINHRDEEVSFAVYANQCAGAGQVNALPAIREKCRLIVVDALAPLCREAHGDQPEVRYPFGGLILGTDPVAVDWTGWWILQECARRTGTESATLQFCPVHIKTASQIYGLGTTDKNQCEWVGLGMQNDWQGVFPFRNL